MQIYGADADDMKAAARWLEDYGVSSVDINMGCPVHKVTRGGGGSAMMCDAGNTVDLVRTGRRGGAHSRSRSRCGSAGTRTT